jgi:hypothetical protein
LPYAELSGHVRLSGQPGDFAAELTAGTQSPTLIMCVANDKEHLQALLMAGLHNLRPPIIEAKPTPPTTTPGMSSIDQLLGLLIVAANQDDESDNADAIAAWEDRNSKLAAAINEAIQQEEHHAE